MRKYIALSCLFGFAAACGSPSEHAFAPLASPIAADPNTWTWVNVEGARCADGSTTGFAVNLSDPAADLVIFFEGGGACRNVVECYVLHAAVHTESGYNETTFHQELAGLERDSVVLDRDNSENPFAGANLVFIPYCTGDLHGGHNAFTYLGKQRPFYHMGGADYELFLARLIATVPDPNQVWLTGFSAGGFATILSHAATAEAYPQARVHVVDDSGLAFADAPPVPEHWGLWRAPADCTGCDQDLSLWARTLAQQHPNDHFAYMSFITDTVLPNYFYMTSQQFSADLEGYGHSLDTFALSNFKYFFVPGRGHGVVRARAESQDTSAVQWLNQMVQGSAAWQNRNPDTTPKTSGP